MEVKAEKNVKVASYTLDFFTKAPDLIGQWLKYSTLDPDVSIITLKNTL